MKLQDRSTQAAKKFYSSKRIVPVNTTSEYNRSGSCFNCYIIFLVLTLLGLIGGFIVHFKFDLHFQKPELVANQNIIGNNNQPHVLVNESRASERIEVISKLETDSNKYWPIASTVEPTVTATALPQTSTLPVTTASRTSIKFVTDLSAYKPEHEHRRFVRLDGKNKKDLEVSYVYSKPKSDIPLQGVVLLLHGCSAHHQFAWYPYSDNCKNCTARPLESMIVQTFYVNGYTTVIMNELVSYCRNNICNNFSLYVCMYLCMYICIFVYVCMYVCMYA